MKARQFCSVCKQWLDMEVVPTGDGDEDDGVIWFRCPQCQGFLPKLGGGDPTPPAGRDPADGTAATAARDDDGAVDADMPWDSPADMMAARGSGRRTAPKDGDAEVDEDADEDVDADVDPDLDGDEDVLLGQAASAGAAGEGGPAADSVAEYAALLAAVDPATAVPYRASSSYDVGQCVHHLAWDDCGVVVAKEPLPGGRRVIKCYFATAGVVRLIEEAPE